MIVEEPEIIPKILNLPLPERKSVLDTDKDAGIDITPQNNNNISQFEQFVGPQIIKSLDDRNGKEKINGLNMLQTKLEELNDLNDLAEPIFRGLEKSPGWNLGNVGINLMIIDIFRHVLVKSEGIKKSSLAIVFPFIVDKLQDRKLRQPITDFIIIMSEAICPSFVLQRLMETTHMTKNNKPIIGKSVVAALELSVEVFSLFGAGDLVANDYVPLLLKHFQSKSAEIKTQCITISAYIYKDEGSKFEAKVVNLPAPIIKRLKESFDSASTLPIPTKTYNRIRSAKPKATIRNKITDFLTSDQIAAGETAQKWAQQQEFLMAFDGAVKQCRGQCASSDLEPIIRIFKKFLNENNKNLISKTLTSLEELAKIVDKDINRYVPSISASIAAAWLDQKAKIREQATKTIDALTVHCSPSPFIKALINLRTSTDSRLDIIKWINSHINEISQIDMDRLVPFVVQCLDDKSSAVRQVAFQVAQVVKSRVPDAFDQAIKSLPSAAQRAIMSHFDSAQPIPSREVEIPQSPQRKKSIPSNEKPETQEDKTKEKELPKFTSIPTQAKKQKRLNHQQARLGLSILSNKQLITTFVEKTKFDAQAMLPSIFFQKLFSNFPSDQIEALNDLREIYRIDKTPLVYCSDIFVRWLATRLLEKNIKPITEGINFIMTLFTDELFSLQEQEVIVPLIFYCINTKSVQVVDSCLDLLFVIRTQSDPMDYSCVLRSCLDICNVEALVHLFSELQFTIIDDPRNPTIFMEIIGYLEHQSIEVAAACGGVISMIARRMNNEEIHQVLSSLTPVEKDIISNTIAIEPPETISFDGFSEMTSIEKIKLCRILLDRLKFKAQTIQSQAEAILVALLHELRIQENDWSPMKLMLYSIHSLLLYCTLQEESYQKTLVIVTFFANRWQFKLVIMENAGIPQLINSILFKLFEKLPPIKLYSTLLEGMRTFKDNVPKDAFHCKCWVAVTMQLSDTIQKDEGQQIVAFAQEHLHDYQPDDTRTKLLSSLIQVINKKKAPIVTTTVPKKSPVTTKTSTPPRKSINKSPIQQQQQQQAEAKPQKPAISLLSTTTRIDISPKKKEASPSKQASVTKTAPARPAPAKSSASGKYETVDLTQLKNKINMLKANWGT